MLQTLIMLEIATLLSAPDVSARPLGLPLANRAEQFPQVQGADMSSFGTADTLFHGLFADLAGFHE